MAAPDVRRWVGERWGDPVFWSEVVQVVKTVAAAVLAWVLATHVLHLSQSFLAPWSALIVVHATLYRTFWQGARQAGAAVVGVVLAWALGNLLGVGALSLSLAMLVGLGIGATPWFAGEFTAVAATALFVITAGSVHEDTALISRLADTGIGIATGLLVNFIVWPPLRSRAAIVAMDALDNRIGHLLEEMGNGIAAGCGEDEVEHWVGVTREIDAEVDRAWVLVRQAQESAWMNPRRAAGDVRDPYQSRAMLRRIEQAVAETRSMAETLAHGLGEGGEWLSAFREPYVALLRDTGQAIAAAQPEVIRTTRERLDHLVDSLGGQERTPNLWPVYGALIVNLRNIMDAMGEVAVANPLSTPPWPLASMRARGRAVRNPWGPGSGAGSGVPSPVPAAPAAPGSWWGTGRSHHWARSRTSWSRPRPGTGCCWRPTGTWPSSSRRRTPSTRSARSRSRSAPTPPGGCSAPRRSSSSSPWAAGRRRVGCCEPCRAASPRPRRGARSPTRWRGCCSAACAPAAARATAAASGMPPPTPVP
jgi:hypothetical protein